jgi:hypothetical protein
MNFKKNPALNQNKRDFLNQAICKFVIIFITSSAKPFSIGKLQCAKERLCKVGLGKLDLKSIDLEYRILGHLYNFSVLALILYQFLLFRLHHACGTIKLHIGKLFKPKQQSL